MSYDNNSGAVAEGYDSKHSGALAEQMLDDYVDGKLGGEGSTKVYEFDWWAADDAGAVTQDVYDAIIAADVVIAEDLTFAKSVSGGDIVLNATRTAINAEGDSNEVVLWAAILIIRADLTFKANLANALIPTKTSDLTNDSGFITADESPKIYHMDALVGESGTVSQEVYDAILAADVVVYYEYIANVFKADSRCIISYITTLGPTVINNRISITKDLNYTFTQRYYTIPTATSELTNDSGFITAADLPPSGGLPSEVIELSSEITLQEGKMLEIDIYTTVTGALALRNPTITDATQGLLFGIRFRCGDPAPQLTFAGGFDILAIWANGEPPLLEPDCVIEILGCKLAGSAGYLLLTWAIYKY